jgi:hypothetical protein
MTAIDINAGPSTPVASLWSLRMTAFVRAGGFERDCVALVVFKNLWMGIAGVESSASLRVEFVVSHPRSPQRLGPVAGDPDSDKNKCVARMGHPERSE